MTTQAMKQQEETRLIPEHHELCPMCNLRTGRHIRNKVYCMDCGYIES